MTAAARRGRPSREQAEAIDRRILDCARACFLEHGLAGTTMETVAERAGVARATLYLRHGDKDALLRAVIADRQAAWSEVSARSDWMLGETTEQRLVHYARTMLRWSTEPEIAEFNRLIEMGAASAADQADMRRLLRAPMLAILAREIASEQDLTGDAHELAAMFLGMLGTWRPGAGDAEINRFAAHVVAVFTGGRRHW